MLSRVREWLTLILIALLPFHALLVTIITKIIAGPGHAPLGILAVWKEVMLAMIILLACAEIAMNVWGWKVREVERAKVLHFDVIDACILLGIAYTILQFSIINSQLSIRAFALGFKYDFLPLLSFLILRRVSWSEWFQDTVIKVLLAVGAIVALYGIATFFLPMSFFVWLGYSDLHSLYQAEGPLAAFQQIGGSTLRRIQSTMSGPNQLGVWLLIPFAISLGLFQQLQSKGAGFFPRSSRDTGILLLVIVAMLLTFSRATWIGASMIVGIVLWQKVQQKRLLVYSFACLLVVVAVSIAVAPQVLIRKQSLLGHIEKPLMAIQTIIAHPFGLGLGSAGPASNRTSDTCIDQPVGSDISWAKDRPDLCIFIDTKQVQPINRTCSCPLLTENWYLQWGVEMGVFGSVLSLMLVFLVLRKLTIKLSIINYQFSIFLAVSIVALFLHAWEDSAVALTVWMLLSALPIHTKISK
jgi:hypothetical protein